MPFPKFISLRLTASLCALLCVSGSAFAQNDFKNLAGPGEETASMRLPDAATLGTRSKTAMIPFRGTGRLIEVPMESTENLRVLLVSPNVKDLALSVAMPGESLREAFEAAPVETTFGFDGNQYAAKSFSLSKVPAGRMSFVIRGDELRGRATEEGFIVVSSDSPYQAYSYINKLDTTVGAPIEIVTSIFDHGANSEGGIPNALTGIINRAEMIVTGPNGKASIVRMIANEDGTYRGSFTPSSSGKYIAQITIRATTVDGEEFIRTSEQVLQAERGVRIGRAAMAQMTDQLRWRIDLPVENTDHGRKVIAHAEVWGIDADGNQHNVGWIGGMAVAERFGKRGATVPVTLDSRWLARSEMKSYELRNIRLQDPDSLVVLGEQENISLPEIYATRGAKESFSGEITDEMRMGKKPTRQTADAAGGKLMLVHGYCSGDAWPQTAQFTNFVKFMDLNKNRTHDQFANLIRNFGAPLPSFGIVAHSQGGAASLHLYTYYWSGLDSATGGSKLIQSVGTPYQGTALAGNLAAIGSVFGAGCGTNNNLTYSGAASWLAGIPSWARAKVSYHTTSFTDVWYRYDYCNIATDLFLSDPDDGVVERAYAQLSGGINMGHKTGWCHTTSMRDPGQTTDSARNASMNAVAAR